MSIHASAGAATAICFFNAVTGGLAPVMVQELVSVIQRINESGVTVVLVEQNVFLALQVAHSEFWFKVTAGTRFKPQAYLSGSRI